MFDIGMSELLLIGIVALIVIGPKDLPALFHTLGRLTARARALGREFTNAMNEAARESGMDDVAKGLKGASNPAKFGLDKLSDAADRFDNWDPSAPGARKTPKPVEDDPARAADLEKIRAASEKAGQAALDREAAAKPAPAEAPAKKPAAKKPAAKKPAAKKPATKKPAAKKPAAKKAAAKPTKAEE